MSNQTRPVYMANGIERRYGSPDPSVTPGVIWTGLQAPTGDMVPWICGLADW